MDLIHIISLTASVLYRLLPIALDVYRAVKDPDKPEKAEDALDLIINQAKGQGLQIGHTEAELARSAVHFAQAKKERHPEAKLQPVFYAKY